MLFLILLLTGIILVVAAVIIAIIGMLPILFTIGGVLLGSYIGYKTWIKITGKNKN